jgi:hypothetical protein
MSLKQSLQLSVAAFAFVCAGYASSAVISVEAGGILLNSTDTTKPGTDVDPWLINETMTSAGTLSFARVPLGDDNPTGTVHSRGKWISKTVLNSTGDTWTSFELELQVILGTPSGQGDGLSFADGSTLTGLFTSDQFSAYTRQDVTRDYLNFNAGDVLPGESVTFNFVITDQSGNDPFFLLQTPNRVDTPAIPEPETYAMLLAGLGLLGLAARRRKQKAA